MFLKNLLQFDFTFIKTKKLSSSPNPWTPTPPRQKVMGAPIYPQEGR